MSEQFDWRRDVLVKLGPCTICGIETRSGVKPCDHFAFRRLCRSCAVTRFRGEIVSGLGRSRLELEDGE